MAVPGLAVGYNPLGRLVAALQWVRSETGKREGEAATSIVGDGSVLEISGRRPRGFLFLFMQSPLERAIIFVHENPPQVVMW